MGARVRQVARTESDLLGVSMRYHQERLANVASGSKNYPDVFGEVVKFLWNEYTRQN
jgi:hypothetical protein